MNGSVCDVPPDVGTSPKPSSALLYVLLAGYPVLFLIGVIGNTLSFLVLHPFGTKISGHVYLSCLAVFDTLSLFFYVLSFWTIMVLRPFLIGRGNYASVRLIDHYLMTEGRCEIRLYLTFTTRMLSVWTVVILSMERFLLIIAPLRFYKFLRPKIAWITMGITCIIIGLINIPWIFSFDYVQKSACLPTAPRECQTSSFFHWLRLIEFILITIVPAIPLVITNAKMALILLRRRKIWLSPLYTNQIHGATMSGVHSNDTEAIGDTFHGKMVRSIHRDAQHQERQLTLQLFLVSVTFCLLSLPSVIIVGIDVFVEFRSSNPHQSEFLSDALHLSLFSFAVNLTINFVIYCLVGKKFRRAVGALIMCKCDQYRRLRSELLSVSDTAVNSFNLSRDAPVTRHRPKSTGLISEPLNVDEFIRVL